MVFANPDNVLETLRKIVTMGKQYDVTGIAIFDRGTYRFERISRNDAGPVSYTHLVEEAGLRQQR